MLHRCLSVYRKSLRIALMASVVASLPCQAHAQDSFNDLVDKVVAQPELAHAWVGIEIYSLDQQKTLFELNADKMFTPGSTTKAVTEGAALALLGADYRFHTRIFRSGPIAAGVLQGDLVLVASGDPNLSGRVRPDGTLSFTNEDHSYGGPAFADYPGAPISSLAAQIARAGIRRITGRVLVDAGMFDPVREVGSGAITSPLSVNDNVVDIQITPGGDDRPAAIKPWLNVGYIIFRNEVRTGKAGSETAITHRQILRDDGSVEVTISGNVAADAGPINYAYPVDDPARFGAAVLIEALAKDGINVGDLRWSTSLPPILRDDAHQVASYTSLPLRQDANITLKVSQNLHAMMMPYVIGGALGHSNDKRLDQEGFRLIREWLARNSIDISGTAQWDGEGGGSWTPRFMTRYLAFMTRQPYFPAFRDALPILGRDGTLADMLPNSPAAGAVHAKTGTDAQSDYLNDGIFVEGKGLVGYTTTPSGEHVAIAIYLNKVPVTPGPGGIPSAKARYSQAVGGLVAQLAAGIHMLPIRTRGAVPR